MIIQKLVRLVGSYQAAQRARIILQRSFRTSFNKYWITRTMINVPVLSLSLWGMSKSDSDDTLTKKMLIVKADALYEAADYEKIDALLRKHLDNQDVEIMWRECRVLYHMSKTASEVEAKRMIYEAYNLISKAFEVDKNHWAVHKWMAVILDCKTNYEGIKERIKHLYTVKEHIMEASKLNPKDPTILYMLGNWCYSVSDLAWYQRKIASVIFGTIPDSSFEEALQYLEAAETLDPMFYSQNLLLLGKTYLRLQRKDDAIKYLKMTADFSARTDDDHKAKQEATKILGTI